MKMLATEPLTRPYPKCPLCHHSWHGLAKSSCRGVYDMNQIIEEPRRPLDVEETNMSGLRLILAATLMGTVFGVTCAWISFRRFLSEAVFDWDS